MTIFKKSTVAAVALFAAVSTNAVFAEAVTDDELAFRQPNAEEIVTINLAAKFQQCVRRQTQVEFEAALAHPPANERDAREFIDQAYAVAEARSEVSRAVTEAAASATIRDENDVPQTMDRYLGTRHQNADASLANDLDAADKQAITEKLVRFKFGELGEGHLRDKSEAICAQNLSITDLPAFIQKKKAIEQKVEDPHGFPLLSPSAP